MCACGADAARCGADDPSLVRSERLAGQLRNDLFAKLRNEGRTAFTSDPLKAALTVFNCDGRPSQP